MTVSRGWLGRDRRETHVLRRLDHELRMDCALQPARTTPSIQQIAAELRRLDRQRRCGPNQYSQRWQAEVVRAYDCWLSLACRCLGVGERLAQLAGEARDLERFRIELALESAGLSLRSRF